MKKFAMLAAVLVALAGCGTTREDVGKMFWDDSKSAGTNITNSAFFWLTCCLHF